MANSDEKWYFTKERLESSPSRQCGIENYKELSYRQQAANFIQDMGQKLKVSQLCINTAIVYMHRFYVFHSFTHFPWASIASASIFLAAKVEEQPRKLEHVIKYANLCKNPHDTRFEINSERYQAQSQDLVFNENILLQTLGFDVAIDHPHTHVVRCCHLVRASKDLAQTSYFMASNSLHLTTMCLQYKPTVVACFCIHLVCKWSNWEIPLSNERREWFSYVDSTVTADLLKQLTEEFLTIFERCPSRLKEKIMAIGGYSPFETDKKLAIMPDMKDEYHRPHYDTPKQGSADDTHAKRSSSRPQHSEGGSSSTQLPPLDREYTSREKQREAERLARHAASSSASSKPNATNPMVKQQVSHSHHRPAVDPKLKQHSRPPASSSSSSSSGYVHRDLLREATRDLGLKEYREKRPNDVSFAETKPQRLNSSSNNSRQSLDPSKIPQQQQQQQPQHLKHESSAKPHVNEIKKHLSNVLPPFLNRPITRKSESSPFPANDAPKSVPKAIIPKQEQHNGSNSYAPVPTPEYVTTPKVEIKEEPLELSTKKPSLFSPEKSPPPNRSKSPVGDKQQNRTANAGSEPELRPVMKKIDQVQGYENLMRDSSIGIKVNHQVPDIITPIPEVKPEKSSNSSGGGAQGKELSKELKPPDLIPPFNNPVSSAQSQPIVNGIETNPTLISNLLKETPVVSHLPSIAAPAPLEKTADVSKESQKEKDHHKERKKKNKEKHKHKDKARNKEDKEKKKKHKDKDREKHKERTGKEKEQKQPEQSTPAIKITISKDKIQPPDTAIVAGAGLKIKIPKDRLKPDTIATEAAPPPVTAPLKIKISKEVINNYSGESKKRERDKTSPKDGGPPAKMSKSSHNRSSESKQNGRSSYAKVSQLGDGATSVHRLAESKYINKGAST